MLLAAHPNGKISLINALADYDFDSKQKLDY